VDAALVALETNLTGMVSLSQQQRRRVPRMDDKSEAFLAASACWNSPFAHIRVRLGNLTPRSKVLASQTPETCIRSIT
jgi:hypothetical protein